MYIEAYYNRARPHSALDYAAPDGFNSGEARLILSTQRGKVHSAACNAAYMNMQRIALKARLFYARLSNCFHHKLEKRCARGGDRLSWSAYFFLDAQNIRNGAKTKYGTLRYGSMKKRNFAAAGNCKACKLTAGWQAATRVVEQAQCIIT
jgi:hypothetical protein